MGGHFDAWAHVWAWKKRKYFWWIVTRLRRIIVQITFEIFHLLWDSVQLEYQSFGISVFYPLRSTTDQKGALPSVQSNYLPFITKEGKYLTEVMTRLFFATQTLVILGRRPPSNSRVYSTQSHYMLITSVVIAGLVSVIRSKD